jgi:sulfite exporter TauE/SafE
MDFLSYLIIGIGICIATWVTIKQKPWWKLTLEEKKKRMPFVITGALLVVLGIATFLIVF